MTTADLQLQLRTLRTAPPDDGFEARLHNALVREANLMQPAARPQRKPLQWLPQHRQWRLAVLVFALSASATAMFAATAVRRQPAPEVMQKAAPVAPALPRNSRTPSPSQRLAEPALVAPAHPDTVAPVQAPEPLRVPPMALGKRGAMGDPHEAPANRPLESAPKEAPRLMFERLGLPDDLPEQALEQRAEPPQLRGRPELDLPERRNVERPERKDDAAKRRDKRSERSRSENAERGLERARDAQQQHLRQR
jgi:hypothetical protein